MRKQKTGKLRGDSYDVLSMEARLTPLTLARDFHFWPPGTNEYTLFRLLYCRSFDSELHSRPSRRAVELARQVGQRERAASYEAGAAVWHAFLGNNGRDAEYAVAFA